MHNTCLIVSCQNFIQIVARSFLFPLNGSLNCVWLAWNRKQFFWRGRIWTRDEMTILKISVACFGSNKGEREKGNDDFRLNSLWMIIFLWRYLRGNSDFLFQIYMLTGHMRIKKQRRNFSYLLLIFFFLVIKRTLKENFRYHNLPYSTYFSSTSFFGGDAFHAQKIHHEFYAFYFIIV